jgi:hypothetical protein
MKKVAILFLLVVIGFGFHSCSKVNGKGDLVTEERTLSGYSSIMFSTDGVVFFTPDSVYSFKVQAQENVIEIIETSVENGKLTIKIKNNHTLGSHDQITYWISAPDINALTVNGSGNLYVESPWAGQDLNMTISGSGNIEVPEISAVKINMNISGSGNARLLNLTAGSLKTNISGSGSVTGTGGTSGNEQLIISGSGMIDLREVMADTTWATISGSGNIYTWAVRMLDATISGSGSIYYRGTPVIYTHISGSGTVKPL